MTKLGVIKEIIDFVLEKQPSLVEGTMKAQNDEILLPIPQKCTQKELEEKAKKLGFIIEQDFIKINV